MKRTGRLLAAVMTLILVMLTGCGSTNTKAVALTVDDTDLTLGAANFYARYTQAQYETYYGSYFGENFWSQKADEEKTYEQSTIESIQEALKKMLLLEDHMEEYQVSVSDADKELITKCAKAFIEANSEDVNEKISADQESVERVMTLIMVESRMAEAIKAKADTNVSDEEAAQKKMKYVTFSKNETNEDGETTELAEDQLKELKKTAEDLVKAAKEDGADFNKAAEAAGQTAAEGTFDAESQSYDAKLIEAADKLKEGEVTGVVDGESAYYVAVLVSEFDKEATETQKQNIVSERQQELYDKVTGDWQDAAKIDVKEDAWKKISFTDVSVKMVVPEQEGSAGVVETDEETTEEVVEEAADEAAEETAEE